MGVCTIGLKVWNKDGYGRREYEPIIFLRHIVVDVRMTKLRDHFLLTRRTEPVGVKQDLHSLQASGKSHNVHLWYVPRFELLQNRMDTKDPVPSSIGVVIPGSVRLAFWGGSVYTTPSGWAQGRGFPFWVVEGNEVGPLTSSTPRATGVELTVR